MRVAIVHSFYDETSPSGENAVVRMQAAALTEAGHDVLVISRSTSEYSRSLAYATKSAIKAAGGPGESPSSVLRDFAPDIVHVHNLFPNWSTRWTREWRDRLVATLHNYRTICASALLWRDGHDCEECLTDGSYRAVLNACYRGSRAASIPLAVATRGQGSKSELLRNSNVVITLNESAQLRYQDLLASRKVVRVPNFAGEVMLGSPIERDPGALPWLFVGRLTQEKGILWLLDNWPTDEEIVVVGSGPLEAEVGRAVERLGPRATFRSSLPHAETLNLIENSRGLIIPSLWTEGIPTVALEALSCGTPLVVSSHCASANDLTKGSAGVIFDAGGADGESLKAALDLVAGRGEDCRIAALKLYSSEFSKEVWLERMNEIYSRVISNTAGESTV